MQNLVVLRLKKISDPVAVRLPGCDQAWLGSSIGERGSGPAL